MLSREACERRVYRLAVLLTGDVRNATRVITTVVGAQPDLRKLDSSHIDRLTVLRSREIKSTALDARAIPPEIAAGLAAMTRQQREAWTFHYVYRMMPRDMAKAMDCSVRAIQQHIMSAESTMREHIGDTQVSAGKTLLEYAMSLDVPDFYRAQIRSRARWKWVTRIAIAITIIAILAGGIWWALTSEHSPLNFVVP